MPRSRSTEMPQRQSPRVTVPLRTSSSDSDPPHHRQITDRSNPKVGDRRSPRGLPSDPLSQKKLGIRIAGLENQLGQAQEELKILKEQLSSAEAAKKEAETNLEKKKKATKPKHEDFSSHETDVYEVLVEKINMEEELEPEPEPEPEPPMIELSQPVDETKHKVEPPEEEKPTFEDLALKDNEISALKDDITEKKKKLQEFNKENETLKSQLSEAALEVSAAQAKVAEMRLRLSQAGQELEESQGDVARLKEKLVAVEGAKEELENEMKKLRIQTEQWRKAADVAATVLAGEGEMNGRRISERCGSMDKHFGGVYDPRVGGYAGFVGSPGFGDDSDDGFGGGKRKSSGIKMFGDLWKKKGHKFVELLGFSDDLENGFEGGQRKSSGI